jgi:ABC-type Na+ efflux pump permease subunit
MDQFILFGVSTHNFSFGKVLALLYYTIIIISIWFLLWFFERKISKLESGSWNPMKSDRVVLDLSFVLETVDRFLVIDF